MFMSEYPLAVVSPNIGLVAETFIRRFMQDLLPGRTAAVTKNVVTGDPTWKPLFPTLVLSELHPDGLKRQFMNAVLWQLGCSARDATEKAIRRFLKVHGVQVILSNYLDESLPYLKMARAMGVRFFAHGHGYDISERLRDARWRSAYLALNEADGIIVVSESIRERLLGIGLDGAKISVIPCMPDVLEAPIVPPDGELIHCLMLGSMVSKKAPILSLDAFRRAREACPRLRLDVVGDGPLCASVRQYVRAFDLGEVVTLHGYQPARGPVVQALRSRAAMFIQHSMTDPDTGDEEGLPVTILEMMGAGIPVVSTKHAGIPEAVTDGCTGFLVDEGDTRAMADRILALARDASLRARMGEAGWRRAKDHFTWAKERECLLQLMGLTVPQ